MEHIEYEILINMVHAYVEQNVIINIVMDKNKDIEVRWK